MINTPKKLLLVASLAFFLFLVPFALAAATSEHSIVPFVLANQGVPSGGSGGGGQGWNSIPTHAPDGKFWPERVPAPTVTRNHAKSTATTKSTATIMSVPTLASIMSANGGGGPSPAGPSGSSPINITIVSPDQYVYTKNWDIATDGFTFYYDAETEPYYCVLGLDGQLDSAIVQVNNNTRTTLYSNATLGEGLHDWGIVCINSTGQIASSEIGYISIDNTPPFVQNIMPQNGSYVGWSEDIGAMINGTGSPANAYLTPSAGSIAYSFGSAGGGGGGPPSDITYYDWGYDTYGLSTGDTVNLQISLNDTTGNTNQETYTYTVDHEPPTVTSLVGAPGETIGVKSPLEVSANVTDNYQLGSGAMFIADSNGKEILENWAVPITLSDEKDGVYNNEWDTRGFDLSQNGVTVPRITTQIYNWGFAVQGLIDPEGNGNYYHATIVFDANGNLIEVYGMVFSGVTKFLPQSINMTTYSFFNESTILTLYDPSDPTQNANNPRLVASVVPDGDYAAIVMVSDAANNPNGYGYPVEVDNTPPSVELSVDKTTVSNTGNNTGLQSPPFNVTANITENHLNFLYGFVYDVSNNISTQEIYEQSQSNPYQFLWDANNFVLGDTLVSADNAYNEIIVQGYFVQNTTAGNEIEAFAYFNASTGEFMEVSTDYGMNPTPLPIYDGLSTFEPVQYHGVYDTGDYVRTKVFTINDFGGNPELSDASGKVLMISVPAPTGQYRIYVVAVDESVNVNMTEIDLTIDNPPVIALVSPADNTTYTSVPIDLDYSVDSTAACYYSMDGSTQYNLTGNTTVSPANGDHNITLSCTDLWNNTVIRNTYFTVAVPPPSPPNNGGGGGGGGMAMPPVNKTAKTEAKPVIKPEQNQSQPAPAPVPQPAQKPQPTSEQPKTGSPTGFFAVGTGIASAIQSFVAAIMGFFARLFG
jgi:hypothetical protein